MIWDKYKLKYDAVIAKQFDEDAYVAYHIKDFVGTQEQIDAERIQLVKEAKNRTARIRTEYSNACVNVLDAYIEELYAGHKIPKVALDMAYSAAYTRHHASGHADIERAFLDTVDDFTIVYNMGLRDGKNGK